MRNSPILIINVDEELTLEDAKIKLKYYGKLSLANSYLIALARKLGATILTNAIGELFCSKFSF